MAEELYNVVFAGELIGAEAPEVVARSLQTRFRLDETQLQGLFSGRPVVVKRDVDLETAVRFRDAFGRLGARAIIEPNETVDGLDALLHAADDLSDPARGDFELAPLGSPLDEIDERGPPRFPDTSALSLVPGDDWSFEDCQPPPVAEPILEIDYLELVPISDPRPQHERERRD